MHLFDYSFLANSVVGSLANTINIIYDLRARNNLRLKENPNMLRQLQTAAIIESVRGSNSIEGIVSTKQRLEELIVNDTPPKTHDEHELLGYKQLLSEMYTDGFSAEFSEDYIRHLHRTLFEHSSQCAGQYKTTNSWIQQRDGSGHISVRFVPVSAQDASAAMSQFVLAYREAANDSSINPLALIACVALDFLCIHPFDDGNGRVSRLLTSMLLLQNGFHVGKLISIEGLIDENKEAYYAALHASSEGWHDNQSDYTPFITYILQLLYLCYKRLDRRYVEGKIASKSKADRVTDVLMAAYVPISKAEICARLPEVSNKTVERNLARLLKEGKIEKIGTYRDARYRRL